MNNLHDQKNVKNSKKIFVCLLELSKERDDYPKEFLIKGFEFVNEWKRLRSIYNRGLLSIVVDRCFDHDFDNGPLADAKIGSNSRVVDSIFDSPSLPSYN